MAKRRGDRTVRLVALGLMAVSGQVTAQQRPADLTTLPPVPTDYTPPRTSWGDYDISHTYQTEFFGAARILFQRPPEYGDRLWVNDVEFARRLKAAEGSDASYSAEGKGLSVSGTKGLTEWMKTSGFGKRTSVLVSPANGQLPPLTPKAKQLFEAGRSGWVPGQNYDWVTDFDTWDRCITRGFPASMYTNRYNNGIRVWQAPGYVVIQLEMLGTRIIPIGTAAPWPGQVEQWMGQSRGHWEGKTLVIETGNIRSGDSVSTDNQKRAAAPAIVTMIGGAPFNTIPTSRQARTVERLTMTSPTSLTHELTYTDPETFTAPWTTRLEWIRDDGYQFYEYACHEGNNAIRGYVQSSRAERRAIARGEKQPETGAADSRNRFTTVFDRDPGASAAPVGPTGASAPIASQPAGAKAAARPGR